MGPPCVSYLTRGDPSFVSKLKFDASEEMGEEEKNPNTGDSCLLSGFKTTVLLANRQKQKPFLQSAHAQAHCQVLLVRLPFQPAVCPLKKHRAAQGQLYPPSSDHTNLCCVSRVLATPCMKFVFQAIPHPLPIHSNTEAPRNRT